MAKIMNKDEIAASEEAFQQYLQDYAATGSMEAYHAMWNYVYNACCNIAKSKLHNVNCPDFEGKVLDATMDVMKKIKKGDKPQKLSSYVYFYVIGRLYNKNTAFNEKAASLDELEENEGDFCTQLFQ